MNIHLLDEKLKKIQQNLNEETIKLNQITQNLNEAKQKNNREEQYHIANEKYKQLISQFSIQYLELCEWYVGPELPKPIHQTFLDSKNDINSLYFLFMMSLFLK
tara:strand:- start:1495 stop:1806 length:312 start_codon:yes stop_codon:yes gene_type:complete